MPLKEILSIVNTEPIIITNSWLSRYSGLLIKNGIQDLNNAQLIKSIEVLQELGLVELLVTPSNNYTLRKLINEQDYKAD